MNNLMVFENKKVEVFELNGQVLFNPYHCGECLELADSSIRDVVRKMNDKQVVKLKNSDVVNSNIRKLNNAGENFLTESGVYKLIFKSKKKQAEKFQDWVTDEVLPQIRKTGSYQSQQKLINGLNETIKQMQGTIEEYRKMCKITCSKKRDYSDYIKKALGINKANHEYERVKSRVFLILGVKKWEDIDFETSKDIVSLIDESVNKAKQDRPYKQMSYFD